MENEDGYSLTVAIFMLLWGSGMAMQKTAFTFVEVILAVLFLGILSDMLNKGVDFLEKDIDRAVNALTAKLEPAMTVIMGVIVGFLLIAIYLPMFDYMSYLK